MSASQEAGSKERPIDLVNYSKAHITNDWRRFTSFGMPVKSSPIFANYNATANRTTASKRRTLAAAMQNAKSESYIDHFGFELGKWTMVSQIVEQQLTERAQALYAVAPLLCRRILKE